VPKKNERYLRRKDLIIFVKRTPNKNPGAIKKPAHWGEKQSEIVISIESKKVLRGKTLYPPGKEREHVFKWRCAGIIQKKSIVKSAGQNRISGGISPPNKEGEPPRKRRKKPLQRNLKESWGNMIEKKLSNWTGEMRKLTEGLKEEFLKFLCQEPTFTIVSLEK